MSSFCPACGSLNPVDAVLCANCGSRLQQINITSQLDEKYKAALVSPTEHIPLGLEEVTIGRDPANKLVVQDPQVSRHHAVIRQCGDSYEVVDLGSFNGTFVNGQRLEGNIYHLLHDGDIIRIGSTIIKHVNPQTIPFVQEPISWGMAPPPVFPFREQPGSTAPPPRIAGLDLLDISQYEYKPGSTAPPPRIAGLDLLDISQYEYKPGSTAPPPRIAGFENPGALPPPPPIFFRNWNIFLVAIPIAFVLMAVILSLVVRSMQGGHTTPVSPISGFWNTLLFVCQMILLTVVICVIPTLVSWVVRRSGYAVLVIVESMAFVAVFVGFGIWLFGMAALGTWILYAAALVVLIEAGSHFVEWRKNTTLKRLKDGTLYNSIEADAEAIEKMTGYEATLYVPVPVGLLLGTIIGLIRHQTERQIIESCVQLVLFLAALVLLYFLIVSFLRMSDPMFRTLPTATPELAKRGGKRGRTAKAQPQSQEVLNQQYIDLACDVSGLRTIYKYDALHNTILLVAFVLVVIKIWLVPIGLPWLIISLLLATLVFSEIPYAIGQYLLHNRILEHYTGGKYSEMAKKLQDYAPVFPPLPFLAALLTTGTAGGILYALLSQIAQNMLTTLVK